MSQFSVQSNTDLGYRMRERRQELGLTIEAAARRAGVGTKTWYRYEAGEPIRRDKYQGVCQALGWSTLPIGEDGEKIEWTLSAFQNDEYWCPQIAYAYGDDAAVCIVVGARQVKQMIEDTLETLMKKPRETHIGEVSETGFAKWMPAEYMMRYDYAFMYELRNTLNNVLSRLNDGKSIWDVRPQTTAEEILYYIMSQVGTWIFEHEWVPAKEFDRDGWIFKFFEGQDIKDALYSGRPVYHHTMYDFNEWFDEFE